MFLIPDSFLKIQRVKWLVFFYFKSLTVLFRIMNYEPLLEQVVEFCKNNPEAVYRPKLFIDNLGLDVPPRGLGVSLSQTFRRLGLLKLHEDKGKFNSYYGFSEKCGSRGCFENWCGSIYSCKSGKGNTKLKMHSEDGIREVRSHDFL